MNVSQGVSDPPIIMNVKTVNFRNNESSCNNNSQIVSMNVDDLANSLNLTKNKSESDKINKQNINYNYRSQGPFEVYMESKLKDKNIGNLHTLSLAKKIFDLNLSDFKKIIKKGKNRISIIFKSYQAANEFHKTFKNSEEYNVYIPINKVTCKGIIKQVDIDFSDEDIKKYSDTNVKECNVLQVRRLSRKVRGSEKNEISYEPTGTVCLAFSGTILPREVSICGMIFVVSPYILPVIQCYNCLLYGHTKKLCRGKSKCIRCGDEQHQSDENSLCNLNCYHCNGTDHTAIQRICPEFTRQKKIKEIMSLDNKTYFDACEMVAPLKNKIRGAASFNRRAEDFPSLQVPSEQSNTINVNERREVIQKNNFIPSYNFVTSVGKKRKPDLNREQSYNKSEYNQCLIAPNGRFNYQPSRKNFKSQTLVEDMESDVCDNQQYVSSNMSFDELCKAVFSLAYEDRMKFINYLTQLKTTETNFNCTSNDTFSYNEKH